MDGAAGLGERVARLGVLPGDGLEIPATVADQQPQPRLAAAALPEVALADTEDSLDALPGDQLAQRTVAFSAARAGWFGSAVD